LGRSEFLAAFRCRAGSQRPAVPGLGQQFSGTMMSFAFCYRYRRAPHGGLLTPELSESDPAVLFLSKAAMSREMPQDLAEEGADEQPQPPFPADRRARGHGALGRRVRAGEHWRRGGPPGDCPVRRQLAGSLPPGELTGDDVIVSIPYLPTASVAGAAQAELLGAGAAEAVVVGPEVTAD
jgi:hypothetical protein